MIGRGLAGRKPTLGTHSPLATLPSNNQLAELVDFDYSYIRALSLIETVGMLRSWGLAILTKRQDGHVLWPLGQAEKRLESGLLLAKGRDSMMPWP